MKTIVSVRQIPPLEGEKRKAESANASPFIGGRRAQKKREREKETFVKKMNLSLFVLYSPKKEKKKKKGFQLPVYFACSITP